MAIAYMGPMARCSFLLRLAALAAILLPAAAHAVEAQPTDGTRSHSSATLITEADSFKPGQPFRIGLKLALQPGWHTYWQNPGDAGEAAEITVTGAKAGPIAYPTPQKLQDGPFTTYAYTGQLLLPLTITPPSSGPMPLKVDANYLVCAQLCVPETASFSLTIPQGTGTPGADAPAFTAADAATPRPSPFAATIAPDGTLRVQAPGIRPTSLYFFPDTAGIIDQGAPQNFRVEGDTLLLSLKAAKPPLPAKPLAGVLTMTDEAGRQEALWIAAKPAPSAATGSPAAAPVPVGIAEALLLAFLGGLILNLMPCVLPVLAMKALALTRLSGAARVHVRREAALYTAGVLAAFGTLGAITLIIGAAGGDAGWGAQFQSALFTTLMAWLMFLVGLNFVGVFEVGAEAAGVGQSLAARSSFFTGLLAVVVATPCTAPFMATALAAAVALPPVAGMAVFLALGLGLAAPYGVLAVAPGLARFLPRPGAWMDRLKKILALPMFATAAWMLWVVFHQSGSTGLFRALMGAALLAFAAWRYGRRQRGASPGLGTILPALVGAAVIALAMAVRPPEPAPMRLADGAERFTQARLQTLLDAHRPVLVDMSAAWCITCLVNERLALSPQPVRDAFAKHNIAYLVGDWTKQDPSITAYMKHFGRNGVPLYVYYPPNGPPVVLPQILTEATVLSHLGA
jgi:thiol:disulfide interchange protein DsbD